MDSIYFVLVLLLAASSNQQQQNHEHHHGDSAEHYHGQDGHYHPSDDGRGWDIRLSVPGEPVVDYPTLNVIPETSFNCVGKDNGYYADIETRCQVFRVCTTTGPSGFHSFLCPNGTLFNQDVHVCDWWMNVNCAGIDSELLSTGRLQTKPGTAMLQDVKKMIMYPMTHPPPSNYPVDRMTMQVYNPPAEIMSVFSTPPKDIEGQKILGEVTVPNSYSHPNTNQFSTAIKQDSYSSGLTSFQNNPIVVNEFQGTIPNVPTIQEGLNSKFIQQQAEILNLQKQFNSNSQQQSIKITKQQFTYPSQFDKQYTVTVPKIPTPVNQPFVVNIPINIPAIDANDNLVSEHMVSDESNNLSPFNNNYNGSSHHLHTATVASIPFVILLLKPTEQNHNHITETPENILTNPSINNFYNDHQNFVQSTENRENAFTNSINYFYPHGYIHPDESYTKTLSNRYIPNTNDISFENNIQNNLDGNFNEKTTTNEYKETTIDLDNAKDFQMSETEKDLIMEQLNKHLDKKEEQLNELMSNTINTTNSTDGNNLITIFSAHVAPYGDETDEKVLKLCIPKDALIYLLKVHNATKQALERHSQSYKFPSHDHSNHQQHHTKEEMVNMLMQNVLMNEIDYSNQQVPIVNDAELYRNQQFVSFQNQEAFRNRQVTGSRTSNIKNQRVSYQNVPTVPGNIQSDLQSAVNYQTSIQNHDSSITSNLNQQSGIAVNKFSAKFNKNQFNNQISGNQQGVGQEQQTIGQTYHAAGQAVQTDKHSQQIDGQAYQNTGRIQQTAGQTYQSAGQIQQKTDQTYQNAGQTHQITGQIHDTVGKVHQINKNAQQVAGQAHTGAINGGAAFGADSQDENYDQYRITSSVDGPKTYEDEENRGEFFSLQHFGVRQQQKRPYQNTQQNNGVKGNLNQNINDQGQQAVIENKNTGLNSANLQITQKTQQIHSLNDQSQINRFQQNEAQILNGFAGLQKPTPFARTQNSPPQKNDGNRLLNHNMAGFIDDVLTFDIRTNIPEEPKQINVASTTAQNGNQNGQHQSYSVTQEYKKTIGPTAVTGYNQQHVTQYVKNTPGTSQHAQYSSYKGQQNSIQTNEVNRNQPVVTKVTVGRNEDISTNIQAQPTPTVNTQFYQTTNYQGTKAISQTQTSSINQQNIKQSQINTFSQNNGYAGQTTNQRYNQGSQEAVIGTRVKTQQPQVSAVPQNNGYVAQTNTQGYNQGSHGAITGLKVSQNLANTNAKKYDQVLSIQKQLGGSNVPAPFRKTEVHQKVNNVQTTQSGQFGTQSGQFGTQAIKSDAQFVTKNNYNQQHSNQNYEQKNQINRVGSQFVTSKNQYSGSQFNGGTNQNLASQVSGASGGQITNAKQQINSGSAQLSGNTNKINQNQFVTSNNRFGNQQVQIKENLRPTIQTYATTSAVLSNTYNRGNANVGTNQQTTTRLQNNVNKGQYEQKKLQQNQQSLTTQGGFQLNANISPKIPTTNGQTHFVASSRVPDSRNIVTKVQVIPAFGFALHSDREREYFLSAISRGLKDVDKIYLPPYDEATADFMISEINRQAQAGEFTPSTFETMFSALNTAPNIDVHAMLNNNFGQGFQTSFGLQFGEKDGAQRISNTQPISTFSDSNIRQEQSLSSEHLGYPKEKPRIAFTF